jgi:MFS family permease
MGYISYGGAAALLALFTWVANPVLALIAMSLSAFAAEFSGPISWTTAMDIGGENVGAVSGFMNTLGQLGASIAPAVTGFLLQLTGNGWNFTFYAWALIYAAGAICWMTIDPTTPLDEIVRCPGALLGPLFPTNHVTRRVSRGLHLRGG